MKAKHVKFTVEFDVLIKDETATMNEAGYEDIRQYILRCVSQQRFYFVRGEQGSHYMRTKNISVTNEVTDVNVPVEL